MTFPLDSPSALGSPARPEALPEVEVTAPLAGRERGIARRYAFLVCGIALFLLATSGAIEMGFEYREARLGIEALQSAQADAGASQIASFLDTIELDVRDVAKLPWGRAGLGDRALRAECHRLMQLVPALTDVQAVQADGRERVFVSRREVDRVGGGRVVPAPDLLAVSAARPVRYSDTFFREDLTPAMRIAVWNGEGAIVATVDLRLLGEALGRLRVGAGGSAWVVDRRGTLIAHPRATEMLRELDLAAFDPVARARRAAEAMPQASDARMLTLGRDPPVPRRRGIDETAIRSGEWRVLPLGDTVGLEGGEVIATAASIDAPGWLLVVQQPRSEALGPALATLRRTLLLIAGGGLVALATGVWFARRMAAPIVTLRRAAHRIAEGDLGATILIDTGDEVEALGRDFNRMAARLRESYSGLEAKIAVRTAELSEARDALQTRAAEVDALNEQLQEQVQELALRKDQAERANAAKSRFLATASHDLRQPMHSISLLIGLLRERVALADPAGLAGMIQSSVDTMERLFGSLLDISRLDAGAVQPRWQEVDLDVLLERLDRTWAPQAQARGLRWVVHRPAHPVRLHTDPDLLERILSNLVSNALRYSVRGGVVVGSRPRGRVRRLEVADTGPGISPDLHDAVFEEFFRAAPAGDAADKGLGLGLSIVRRSAAILGHSVALRSLVGRGTVVSVDVPLSDTPTLNGTRDTEPDEADAAMPAQVSATLTGAFVLVVDDDDMNLRALADVLRGAGCLVATATSADQAVAALDAHLRAPDLLICDLQLDGGGTGLDAISRVRKRLDDPVLPALLLTAQVDLEPATASAARDMAVPMHIKPIGVRRLLLEAAKSLGTGAAQP